MQELLVNRLFKPAQEKVWLGEMTIAVDLGRKATKQTKNITDAKNFSNKMGLVCDNHWFFA